MYIKGSQLLFLIQVLKDSLQLPQGNEWVFNYKSNKRKEFYEELMRSLFSGQSIEVQNPELLKAKNIK